MTNADPPTSRPQPGDIVKVTNLAGTFTVESFDGRAMFTLRSEHGATLKAGVLVVTQLAKGGFDEQSKSTTRSQR